MSGEHAPTAPSWLDDGMSQTDAGSRSWWLREPGEYDVRDITAWLAEPDINQWFDFGQGRHALPVLALQLMLQSTRHRLRVFGETGEERASGLVAISDLSHVTGTGSFWVLRDRQRPGGRDLTFLASTQILRDAFETLQLHCITAWAVDCNVRSQRLLERIGFRALGLQRNCHVMQEFRFGRLLYDLLPADLCLPAGSPALHT